MERDRTMRDREAQPYASRGRIARIVEPKEGLEDFGQRIFRHARTVIANCDADRVRAARECDLNRTSRQRVANRIAQHVFDGSAQYFAISAQRSCRWFVAGDLAVSLIR